MHKQQIKEIVSQLQEVVKVALPASAFKEGFGGLYVHDGASYVLPVEHQGAFNDIARKFLKNKNWSQKFSEKFIYDKIRTIFASILLGKDTDNEAEISALIDELDNYETEITVYVPLIGIRTAIDIAVGNIRLLMPTPENIGMVKGYMAAILNDNPKASGFYETFSTEMEQELFPYVMAEFKVIAEFERAHERANEESRRALEILRFTSKAKYELSEDIRIGLKGEPGFGYRKCYLFSDKILSIRGDAEGSMKVLQIDDPAIEAMDRLGFTSLSAILAKPQPNNYEEIVLRSVHWFSSALQQQELENAFLCLMIALETIFTSERGNPITNSVAEGVAFVLGTNLESRKKLKKTIKEYYGMRSGVSHGGNKVILDSDYYNLMNIVGSVIVTLIEKASTFTAQKEFTEWIEDLRLT